MASHLRESGHRERTMNQIQIRISHAYTYRIVVAEAPNVDGEIVDGTIDPKARLIELHHELDREQRRLTLRHEIMHAYHYAFPGSRDNEDQCDFAATVSEDLDRQMEAMGGWAALDRLFARFALDLATRNHPPEPAPVIESVRYEPIKQAQSFETSAAPRGGRAQCGRCETIMADGSIVTSTPWFKAGAGGRVVRRQMYCAHCDCLMQWLEGATLAGTPNRSPLHEPEYITDREVVEAFLKANPRAVGMVADD